MLFLTFIAFFVAQVGIQPELVKRIDAIVGDFYPGENVRYEIQLRWIPNTLHQIESKQIESVNYIGKDAPKALSVFEVHYTTHGQIITQNVQALISVWKKVPTLTQRLSPNKAFETVESVLVWQDVTRNRTPIVEDIISLKGKIATGYVSPNRPIRASEIKEKPLILPGDAVKLIMSSGAFRIELPAQARESAASGEIIQVYSARTKKMYQAKVVDADLVIWEQTL